METDRQTDGVSLDQKGPLFPRDPALADFSGCLLIQVLAALRSKAEVGSCDERSSAPGRGQRSEQSRWAGLQGSGLTPWALGASVLSCIESISWMGMEPIHSRHFLN